MKNQRWRIWHHFRAVLGELSVEEIMNNKELIKRAEFINSLIAKAAM